MNRLLHIPLSAPYPPTTTGTARAVRDFWFYRTLLDLGCELDERDAPVYLRARQAVMEREPMRPEEA